MDTPRRDLLTILSKILLTNSVLADVVVTDCGATQVGLGMSVGDECGG